MPEATTTSPPRSVGGFHGPSRESAATVRLVEERPSGTLLSYAAGMPNEEIGRGLRVLAGRLGCLRDVTVRSYRIQRPSPAARKKLEGLLRPELLDGLGALAGAELWWSGPSAPSGGALRVPRLEAFAGGLLPATDPRYDFDTSRDAAFAVIDHQNDEAQGLLVEGRDGATRYVCARAGKARDAVTVATTFAGYLEVAIERAAHFFWGNPGDRLADGVTVGDHIAQVTSCFPAIALHASPGAVAEVTCVAVEPADLERVRAARVRGWKQRAQIARSLKVTPEALHRELLREDLPTPRLMAALKNRTRPALASRAALRRYLLADLPPAATVDVHLAARVAEGSFPLDHAAELLLADAPGAARLSAAIGDKEALRFDAYTATDACHAVTVATEGRAATVVLTLDAGLVPTGLTPGATWQSAAVERDRHI